MGECTGSENIAELKAKSLFSRTCQSVNSDYSLPVPRSKMTSASRLFPRPPYVTVPLVGGKVHGSLARAGKVKHQTPKVEKAEKKKKKTGRAKRRVQYNRRFVNVVPTFGRKKGPNANAA